MLLVDMKLEKIYTDSEIKEKYASKEPYGEWIDQNTLRLRDLKIPNEKLVSYSDEELMRLQKAFGYSYEEYASSKSMVPERDTAFRPTPLRFSVSDFTLLSLLA